MAKSMTAYGRARGTACGKDITVEIKSVNNRFFDCSVKLPRAFSFLEERVKPYLSSRSIARGKVDVFISIDVVDSPEVNIALDAGYAERYIAALREIGYDGFLTIERECGENPVEDITLAASYIRKLL